LYLFADLSVFTQKKDLLGKLYSSIKELTDEYLKVENNEVINAWLFSILKCHLSVKDYFLSVLLLLSFAAC
jgi:ABC-type transport system involved in cytochrome bd biosynthesis fused ATPase/permease subunit